MRRFWMLTAFFTAAALMTPVTTMAQEHREKKYYDREGRDYHSWDDHEDRAYRVYLGEQHREYREFGRTKAVQQQEYFKWRHGHPDEVIVKEKVK